MVVVYSGSFPFDPEVELQNFERKQAEYEAAYRRTKDPLVLCEALAHVTAASEALAHATAARQPPPRWLVKAIEDNLLRDRTDRQAERFQDRMRHVERYRCVRDLCQKGHAKKGALDLAEKKLAAAGGTADWTTIKDSYEKVKSSLERLGRDSEFFYLVARSDPTRVPVSVTQRSDGTTVINGVAVNSTAPCKGTEGDSGK